MYNPTQSYPSSSGKVRTRKSTAAPPHGRHLRLSILLLALVLSLCYIQQHATANNNLASLNCFSSATTTGFPLPFVNISGISMCEAGYYCPNSDLGNTTTYPRYCPSSSTCISDRHNSKFCSPQGPLEPIPCPAGNYCPTGKVQLVCPADHWCPVGTTEPNSCSSRGSLMYCPEGTSTPVDLSGLVLMAVWNVVVVALYMWARCQRGRFVDLSMTDAASGSSSSTDDAPLTKGSKRNRNSGGGALQRLESTTKDNKNHTLLSNTEPDLSNEPAYCSDGGNQNVNLSFPDERFRRTSDGSHETLDRPLSPTWDSHGCYPDGDIDPTVSPTSADISPTATLHRHGSHPPIRSSSSGGGGGGGGGGVSTRPNNGESFHSSSNNSNNYHHRPSLDSGHNLLSSLSTPPQSAAGRNVDILPKVPGLVLAQKNNNSNVNDHSAGFVAATSIVHDNDSPYNSDLDMVLPDEPGYIPETARGDRDGGVGGAVAAFAEPPVVPKVFLSADMLKANNDSAVQQQLRSRLNEEDIALVSRNIARVRGSMMPLHIEFKDLAVEVGGKVLLRGVTGTIRPGRVTAIMGPSGAGKTVFLTRLLDKLESNWKTSGELNINRRNGQLSDYRHMYGYVPQDDILHPELTVYENVWFSAQARLPCTWSEEEKARHVNAVIRLTGLEDVQHQIVGEATDVRQRTTDPNGRAAKHNRAGQKSKKKITKGGLSRKRTSVAMELAAAPSGLFLDEPTTGLDSATAMDLCILLKAVAERSQLTVGMVIHQPRVEIWHGMDEVLLLAPGGKTVFIGPKSTTQSYFNKFVGLDFAKGNPADLILDGISENAAKCEGAWERFTDYISAYDDGSIVHYDVVDEPVVSMAPSLLISTAVSVASVHYGKLTIDEATLQFIELYNDATAVASPRRHRKRQMHRPKRSSRYNSSNDGAAITEMMPEADEGVFDGALVPEAPAPNHPGFVSQFITAHYRSLLKQSDRVVHIVASVILASVATAFLGVSGIKITTVLPLQSPYTLFSPLTTVYITPMLLMMYFVAMSASTSSVAIQSLCDTRQQYWKECSTGRMNPVAYFLGVTTAEIYRLIMTNNHMVLVAYFMWQPVNSYWSLYIILLVGLFGLDSQATLLGLAVPPAYAPLLCTIANLFISLLNGFPAVPYLVNASFTFYLTEAAISENFRESAGNGIYRNIYKQFSFDHDVNRSFWLDVGVAMGFVIFYRLQALSMMITLHKSKQK